MQFPYVEIQEKKSISRELKSLLTSIVCLVDRCAREKFRKLKPKTNIRENSLLWVVQYNCSSMQSISIFNSPQSQCGEHSLSEDAV